MSFLSTKSVILSDLFECGACRFLLCSLLAAAGSLTQHLTIGDGTVTYPLTDRCCAPVLAASLRTRTRYATIVSTNATGGTFKLLGRGCCAPNNALASIDGTAPA